MARFFKCDACGDEMDAPTRRISNPVVISGDRVGEQLRVDIDIRITDAEDGLIDPPDLCRTCAKNAVLRLLGATPAEVLAP